VRRQVDVPLVFEVVEDGINVLHDAGRQVRCQMGVCVRIVGVSARVGVVV
jgi:hypothetical protein